MSDEPKTIKFQLMLSESEAKAIDDWGFQNRIRTRAEAIRRLCQIGILATNESRDTMDNAANLFERNNIYVDALTEGQDPMAVIGHLTQFLYPDFLIELASNFRTAALVEGLRTGSSIENALSDLKDIRESMDIEYEKLKEAVSNVKITYSGDTQDDVAEEAARRTAEFVTSAESKGKLTKGKS